MQETNTVEETKTKRSRPPVIPSPVETASGRKPIKLRFHVGKDFVRRFEFPQLDSRRKPTVVYHLYPTLGEWVGRTIPDGVNPRSHDPECLKSPVAKRIEQTIVEKPEDFYLANRGTTLIAESVHFDAKSGDVEVVITDIENQGLADGATTDAVIAKVQTRLAREMMEQKDATYTQLLDLEKSGKVPEILQNARLHLEVIEGLSERERIANLVEGRNTSRQVKGWSMADFRGEFEFLKKILDADDSQFKGKIGYEENSSQDMNILDILSIVTLFHPEFDDSENGTDKAPTIAYANKGRMDARLLDDALLKGYKSMIPIIPDVLKLHDYVFANFERSYNEAYKNKARLGRREGVQSRLLSDPYELPLTGLKSNYVIPSGFIFPLLAALRALVSYRGGKCHWKIDPFSFFDKYGKKLVAELMEQVEAIGGNPNVAGKRKLVYTALHTKAKLLLSDEMEDRRSK